MNDFHTSDGTPSLYELTEDQATGYLKAAIWADLRPNFPPAMGGVPCGFDARSGR